MKNRRISLVVFLLVSLTITSVYGQDKLLLMSGKVMNVDVMSVEHNEIKYVEKGGDNTERIMPKYRIFSIEYADGKEDVVYKQDTIIGRFETVDQMRMYVYGEQDAFENHKNPMAFIITSLYGAAGGYALATNFLVVLVPLSAIFVNMIIPVNMKSFKPRNEKLMREPMYLEGYKKVAKSKKVKKGIAGAVIGTLVGAATFYLIVKPATGQSDPF